MAAPKDEQKRQRVESGSHFWQSAQYKVVTANSYLDHQCKLHIEDRPGNVRNTGIICTIGKYMCRSKLYFHHSEFQGLSFEVCEWDSTPSHLKWSWGVWFSAHLNLVKLYTIRWQDAHLHHTWTSREVLFVAQQVFLKDKAWISDPVVLLSLRF